MKDSDIVTRYIKVNLNYFQLNDPHVSAEDFKSEILAVNLMNGHYHSLRESAVPIWRLLMEGRNLETIVQWLAPIYKCSPEELALDVGLFVSELEKQELIIPAPGVTGTAPPSDWLADFSQPYAKPVLETYTDMQDLLLLDPIHDVDVSGWPNVAEPKKDEP